MSWLSPHVKYASFGDIESVKELINENTAAIFTELIQGEAGVHPAPLDYVKALRELCNEKDLILVDDEVQAGIGRTGKMFAYEHYGIVPDVICMAKAIAGGLPMGATFAREEVMNSFQRGEHSSTFSGNPLVCAAASAAIDVLVEEKLPERAATNGNYFKDKLNALAERHNIVREVRGLGLMLGLETRFDVYNILVGCMNRGVLVLDAGRNVVRFLPPLVIETEQIDKVINALDEVMENEN